MRKLRRHLTTWQLLAASMLVAACTPANNETPGTDVVRPGIEVVLEADGGPLRNQRVGLITNHTGQDREGRSSIDLLHDHPEVTMVALFAPEHGIRGTAGPGERIASQQDPQTGLPIHSLYGQTRRPTAEMLADVDVLVFDIQDIGTRYYTYVWTMALSMQSAAEHGLPFVVLDRPNPIGGELVQGRMLDPDYATFVGLYPVPMRHGLTAGELAMYVNEVHHIQADLQVVRAEGWKRHMWFDDTHLPWIPPSPNMPSLESATHYPGTCLFEGTNLSVGRGTPEAFSQIGAPWLDHLALQRSLEEYEIPGVRFDAVVFKPEDPGDGKFHGQSVNGIRFSTTDRMTYDPTYAAVAALLEIRRLHPDQLRWHESHFDRLAGSSQLRRQVEAGEPLQAITSGWHHDTEEFRRVRSEYLLYDGR